YPECSYKKPFVVKTGAICPECGGELVERKSRKSAKIFYGCANYPTCSFVVWDRPLPVPCPNCSGLLTLGNGRVEAVCQHCGALVGGALEAEPVIVGYRSPETERRRGAGSAAANEAPSTRAGKTASGVTRRRTGQRVAARMSTA